MEGKTVQQLLVATGHGYDAVREHLSEVAPQLLKEPQDLHDRTLGRSENQSGFARKMRTARLHDCAHHSTGLA
jgi:hypothetical protein